MFGFTLKQLRYIEAAARTGSIANAALELNISQSSITAAIDKFEEELGYELFIRIPAKGIITTPSGEEAIHLIRSMMDTARHFDGDMRSIGGQKTGTLRIACYATSAPQVLPRLLRDFIRLYPNISIKLLEGDMRTIIEFLDNGDADIALTYDTTMPGQHGFEPLFEAPPHAVIPSEDPLAVGDSVSLAELAVRPMIMLDLPRAREYFISLFENQGLSPNIAHSTRSAEIARALVAGGFGFTILNIRYVEQEVRHSGLVMKPITGPIVVPVFGIATLTDARQPKIVAALVDHCRALREARVFDEIVVKQ